MKDGGAIGFILLRSKGGEMRAGWAKILFVSIFMTFFLGGCKFSYEELMQKLGLKDRELLLGSDITVDFGAVPVGEEARQQAVLYGVTLSGYEVKRLEVKSGKDVFSITNNKCEKPDVEKSVSDVCSIEVAFRPKAVRQYAGKIAVYGKDTLGDKEDGDIKKIAEVKLTGLGGEVKLTASPDSYDWGRLRVDDKGVFKGEEVTFSIEAQEGSVPIVGVSVDGAGFTITDNTCAGREEIGAGGKGCKVKVIPSVGTKEGTYSAELLVKPVDRFSVPLAIPLKAVAKYLPKLEVNPEKLTLSGEIKKGSSSGSTSSSTSATASASVSGEVTVKNSGYALLTIKSISFDGGNAGSSFKVTHTCPVARNPSGGSSSSSTGLEKGASCTVTVSGAFSQEGVYQTVLVISTEEVGDARIPVTATIRASANTPTGSGQGGGSGGGNTGNDLAVVISPSLYNYGVIQVGGKAEARFRVTNIGDVDAEVTEEILTQGSVSPFSLGKAQCSSVKVGESCDIVVVFSPAATGEYDAVLRVKAVTGGGTSASGSSSSSSFSVEAGLLGRASSRTWPAGWSPYVKIYRDKVQGLVEYTVVPSGSVEDLDISGVTYRWNASGGEVLSSQGNSIVVSYDKEGIYKTSVEVIGGQGEYVKVEFPAVEIKPSDSFGLRIRQVIADDRWMRAPSYVTVTADVVNVPEGDQYQGTDFYLDGERVSSSSGLSGSFIVSTPGTHVIELIGRTRNGVQAETYTTVTLYEGDAPKCSIKSEGDGKTSLILTAVCEVERGTVNVYEWYVNGALIPYRGYKIDFAKSDLDKGIKYVVLKAYTDKGKMSEWVWK